MRFLVTAGSTEVDIDLVRQLRTEDPDYDIAIGNGFKGATGEAIARYIKGQGHEVTIITSDRDFRSHDDVLKFQEALLERNVKLYRTYDELKEIMEERVRNGNYDVIIHSAAVSDFYVAGVYYWEKGILFPLDNTGKIPSSHKRLFLDLQPTEKLVDKIREPWGFKGKLVKFKLQVGITNGELLNIAAKSMTDSKADFIVANCREWYKERAYILGTDGREESVSRNRLASELYKRLCP